MTPLWLLPLVVVVAGVTALVVIGGRSAEEARRLVVEVRRLRGLGVAVGELEAACRSFEDRRTAAIRPRPPLDPGRPSPT